MGSVVGRVATEMDWEGSSLEFGELAAFLRDSIKWLQATTFMDVATLLVWSEYNPT